MAQCNLMVWLTNRGISVLESTYLFDGVLGMSIPEVLAVGIVALIIIHLVLFLADL
jgi:hypothetical protein